MSTSASRVSPFAARGDCDCAATHEPRLVVITGGPGAGKTAVLEMASRTFCRHVGVLPEAAGVVFSGGFPRLDSDSARRSAQRAIATIQRELELIATSEGDLSVVLCDRGTIDGAAYWPGHFSELFESAMGSSLAFELARYAAVIHLRTPPAHHGYNHQNGLRIESAEEALVIDERIAEAWAGHPEIVVIDSADDFLVKAKTALAAIATHIPECCRKRGPAK